jgi:hypothetical protein
MKQLKHLQKIVDKCSYKEFDAYILVFIPPEYENISESLEFHSVCFQMLVTGPKVKNIICVPLSKWRDLLDYGTIANIETK